jgi:hypothetical protein
MEVDLVPADGETWPAWDGLVPFPDWAEELLRLLEVFGRQKAVVAEQMRLRLHTVSAARHPPALAQRALFIAACLTVVYPPKTGLEQEPTTPSWDRAACRHCSRGDDPAGFG